VAITPGPEEHPLKKMEKETLIPLMIIWLQTLGGRGGAFVQL